MSVWLGLPWWRHSRAVDEQLRNEMNQLWMKRAQWGLAWPAKQFHKSNKLNDFEFNLWLICWSCLCFDLIKINIITVNKGLLFIKYVNAISITFRIIKRFNFIYRILVLLKYSWTEWNEFAFCFSLESKKWKANEWQWSGFRPKKSKLFFTHAPYGSHACLFFFFIPFKRRKKPS